MGKGKKIDISTLAKHALSDLKKTLSLKEALLSVTDFRIDRRKKYPLYEILMITVCAMIDGAKGPLGVASLRSALVLSSQYSAASVSKEFDRPLHWLLVVGCWLLKHFGRRAIEGASA